MGWPYLSKQRHERVEARPDIALEKENSASSQGHFSVSCFFFSLFSQHSIPEVKACVVVVWVFVLSRGRLTLNLQLKAVSLFWLYRLLTPRPWLTTYFILLYLGHLSCKMKVRIHALFAFRVTGKSKWDYCENSLWKLNFLETYVDYVYFRTGLLSIFFYMGRENY